MKHNELHDELKPFTAVNISKDDVEMKAMKSKELARNTVSALF